MSLLLYYWQADFFITYILTTGWAGFPLEILQSGVLAFNFMTRMYVDIHRPLLTGVYSLPYYRQLPHVLLFVMVGLTYSIITPLLLPFLLVYFILGYIVFRNQVNKPNLLSPLSCSFSYVCHIWLSFPCKNVKVETKERS